MSSPTVSVPKPTCIHPQPKPSTLVCGGSSSTTTTTETTPKTTARTTRRGHYNVGTGGAILNGRYRVLERLGHGSFGQVVAALDEVTRCKVAVKLIKADERYTKQAEEEARLLDHIQAHDPHDRHHVVRTVGESFMHEGHKCFVFELLSENVYTRLARRVKDGLPSNLAHVRDLARQLLTSLRFLASPEVNVVHCDLKPENVVYTSDGWNGENTAVKMIDFGSSYHPDICSRRHSYVQSRFYRSPEVVLGLEYSQPADMWSLGCMLMELVTGQPLFTCIDVLDLMRQMVALKGLPPAHMIEAGRASHTMFTPLEVIQPPAQGIATAYRRRYTGYIPRAGAGEEEVMDGFDDWEGRQRRPSLPPARFKLRTQPRSYPLPRSSRHLPKSLSAALGRALDGHPDRALFLDLVEGMLEYDPARRITPAQALDHPFFRRTEAEAEEKRVARVLEEVERGPSGKWVLVHKDGTCAPALVSADDGEEAEEAEEEGADTITVARTLAAIDVTILSVDGKEEEEATEEKRTLKPAAHVRLPAAVVSKGGATPYGGEPLPTAHGTVGVTASGGAAGS